MGRIQQSIEPDRAPAGTRRIRVINGPLRGSVYDPSAELVIGRGDRCDIQLVHDGISRRHARITTNDQGRHVVVDLRSTNGTFVDNRRIDRRVLEVGMMFEVMRNRFIYEQAPSAGRAEPGAPSVKAPPIYRTTIEYSAFKAEGASEVEAPTAGSSRERAHPLHYPGDILGDIARFRSLRLRLLRGDGLADDETAEFERLESRMRPPDGNTPFAISKRVFRRFSCRVAASLRMFTGESLPVEVIEIAVDSARISVGGAHSMFPDTFIWLAIERMIDGAPNTLVFPGRAVWVRSRDIGMNFSGAPGWSPHEAEAGAQRTLRSFRLDEPAEEVETPPSGPWVG